MTVTQAAVFAEHLLPPNATHFERALSAPSKRLLDIPTPIERLWRPMECPVEQLPWLAWALSVDFWDATWDELTKRRVVASSIEMHRHKGTIGALRRAIGALGYEVEVKEWFQYSGQPYRFKLEVTADAQALRQADYDIMIQVALRAKNVRSYLEAVTVGTRVESQADWWKVFALSTETVTIEPQLVNELAINVDPYGVFTAHTYAVTVYPQEA